MKCECVTKHSGSFSFIKHVRYSHINSTMSTKLMKVLWVFLHGFIHMNKGGDGIWKAFATFFWFQLPYYCLVIIVLMEENFFSKISNRYSLKFKLTRYYENDSYPQMRVLYSNTTLKWTFPLHPTEQILNCCDCWQTVYKLDTHVPCTPNISPPASNVIKQHSVWFQILCIWLQDLSKVPLGYQLFFLHYFSVVDAG